MRVFEQDYERIISEFSWSQQKKIVSLKRTDLCTGCLAGVVFCNRVSDIYR